MQIVDFTRKHIEAAVQLTRQNYEDERGFVPALPPILILPDLEQFADNNMSVTAFENDIIIGFLCSY